MKNSLILWIFSLTIMNVHVAFSQCKAFAKNTCVPLLAPYKHNGQFNICQMTLDETYVMELLFYSGANYRMVICNEDKLDTVVFKVKNMNGNILFDSNQHNKCKHWDFRVNKTELLIIECYTSKKYKSNPFVFGCVALIIGSK